MRRAAHGADSFRSLVPVTGLVVVGLLFTGTAAPVVAQSATAEATEKTPAGIAAQLVDADGFATEQSVRGAIDRGIEYLLAEQLDNGSWGGVRNATFTSGFANPATYHCWTVGTTALVTLALLDLGTDDRAKKAADRGLDFLIANADLKRPAEWDLDNNWGLVYGLRTLARALRDERYAGTDKEAELRAAGMTMLDGLYRYQSPRGGWGYYANPNAGWRPDWATSFTTAVGVLALVEAKEAGLEVSDKVLRAGVRAIERCRQPNGAYLYSVDALPRHLRMESINQVKGSLGRIQVCNYALMRAGVEISAEEMQKGVDEFFEHHKFLDVARNKPIPHEAYYANAAYFYMFGHYYAAAAIDSLPEGVRAPYAKRLRNELIKTQQADGAMWDFWIANTTKAYGTAFGVMALAQTLP